MNACALETMSLRAGAMLLAAMTFACAPLPPQQPPVPLMFVPTVPVEQRASPNFDARRPHLVIIHHTTNDNPEDALKTLTDPARKVSSHYLIARDGRIMQLVDERERAWHAGESYWAGIEDINSASIGIELDNNGREPFAEPLIESLLRLLGDLRQRFSIPIENVIGHGDVAPGRKVDPSALFPWQRLASQGYGLWCDPPYPAVPAGVETALLLQAFGYNVWSLDAAVAAFKRHFVPGDPSPLMSEQDRSVLYCLVMQKQGQGDGHAQR